MKAFFALVGAVLLMIAFMFGMSALGLIHLKVFGPRFQEVDREIFESTPSFVQGKEQTLSELRLEYQRAKSPGEKSNIRAMIVNEAATVDINMLKDSTLRSFVLDMRRGP